MPPPEDKNQAGMSLDQEPELIPLFGLLVCLPEEQNGRVERKAGA